VTIDQTLIALRRAAENDYPWSVSPHEARALVAEVEHLRAMVAALRASVPPTRPTDYGHEVWTAALRAALDAERAAVVAWLRELADAPETYVEEAIALREASACISRGEHRREEEP